MSGKGRLAAADPRHGRASTYSNWGCRCDACRAAWRDYCREYKRRRYGRKPREEWSAQRAAEAALRHGTEATYKRCKCGVCTAAANKARAVRRLTPNVKVHNAAGYSNGCRCPDCYTAHRDRLRVYAAARRSARRAEQDALDLSLIRRAQERHAIAASATGELADLVREQERDDRTLRIAKPWEISLDAPVFNEGVSRLERLPDGRLGSDAWWVEPLLDRIDQRRAIDSYAEEAA